MTPPASPNAPAADDSSFQAPAEESSGAPPQSPGRILVVDDVAVNVRLLTGILKVEGFHVEGVPGGAEALEKLKQAAPEDAPDVVLSDVMMPGMDGFELCRRIRASPSTSRLPVVMVTARHETEDRVRALEAGADDFLSKPVDELEVVARVRSLVRAKRDRDALEAAHRDLQQAQQARENLASMLVHDLRTPLTTMLASLDLLLPSKAAPGPANAANALGMSGIQGELLALCARSGRHMLSLVNQLLDIARLEDGEMPLRIEPVRAADIIEEAAAHASARAQASSNRIEIDIHQSAAELQADPDLLRRVLINLLGNAVKFTRPNTPVRVEVRTVEASQAQASEAQVSEQDLERAILFVVSDQGPGVEEADRERIFDKFAQAKSGRQAKRPSSGLGLFFCRLAIEAHGGRIWVQSREGQGSIFCFTLPPQPASEAQRHQNEAPD